MLLEFGPWDSPGKHSGVGYHFLLQCVKVHSKCISKKDCCLPGSSVHGIFQARVLEWGATDINKIDRHKSVAILHTNNKISEREIKEKISFNIT